MGASKKKTRSVDYVKFVEQIRTSLEAIEKHAPSDASMTVKDKRRAAKLRKGGESIVRKIAILAQTHGLDSPSLDSHQMLDQLDAAATLGPAVLGLKDMLRRVGDMRFIAMHDSWSSALQFYALMRIRARTDGSLAKGLAPIVSFFNQRHENVSASRPTKTQTRLSKKLRDAQELLARVKPRAGGSAPSM